MPLLKRYRHLGRYREIANVLVRHGFGYLIDQAGLGNLLHRWGSKRAETPKAGQTAPQRMFNALNTLGPTFVKMGQIFSTRPDLIPREYMEQLVKLQDQATPFSFDLVQALFYEEQGQPLEKLFKTFDPEPMACASIAQVHRAELLSGEAVVVKVQRPEIRKNIEVDLEILFDLARMLEARTAWGKHYGLVDIIEEFSKTLRAELDFTLEGRNTDRFRQLFDPDPTVVIPRVYWALSSPRILVIEYIKATKLIPQELQKAGFDAKRVAQHLVNAILKQVYYFGFFHADPHPGNLAVLPGERIVFMDFGQVGRLDQATREKAVNLVLAMVRYDVDGVLRGLLDIGVVDRKINRPALRRELSLLQQKYYGLPLAEIPVGQAMQELIDLSCRYAIRIPPEFALAIKCLITNEGVIQELDPSISLIELAEPLAKDILRKRLTPQALRKTLTRTGRELWDLMHRVPRQVENVLGLIEEGEVKLVLEHKNLPRFFARLNTLANRMSLSILIASLIVGSSLVVKQRPGSFLGTLPIAEIGYLGAVAMGFWLIISIVRSGRY